MTESPDPDYPDWDEKLLVEAAESGNQKEVNRIISLRKPGKLKGFLVDVNWGGFKTGRRTALHVAVDRWDVDMLELLLGHPLINVNYYAMDGLTPFMRLSVNWLEKLRAGGEVPVHAARCAQLLMGHGNFSVNELHSHGASQFHFCAVNNLLDLVKLMLHMHGEKGLVIDNGTPGSALNPGTIEVTRLAGHQDVVTAIEQYLKAHPEANKGQRGPPMPGFNFGDAVMPVLDTSTMMTTDDDRGSMMTGIEEMAAAASLP